ncbi:hypothetical protein ASD97_39755 [Streptomyces sp. Root63]|nr:hypothetical protein ASD29_38695 [Streptomyces sp. Root1295]KRA45456.1 hypothetical protein ASD97_39755 [Streptomyces sp. Root63]
MSLRALALVSRFAAVAHRCRGALGAMSLPLIALANSASNRSFADLLRERGQVLHLCLGGRRGM